MALSSVAKASEVIIDSGIVEDPEVTTGQVNEEVVGNVLDHATDDLGQVVETPIKVATLSPSELAKEYEHLNKEIVKDVIFAVTKEGVTEENKEVAVRKLLAETNDEFGSLNTIESLNTKSAVRIQTCYFGRRKDRTQAETPFPPTRRTTRHHKCAVIIGVTYPDTDKPLPRVKADVLHMKFILMNQFSWRESRIFVLTDFGDPDNLHTNHRSATKDNILLAARQLVKNADWGDRLFFYFSGHGSRYSSSSENDGFDERIVTSDGYHISDDTLYSILCHSGIPAGVSLTCIFDSCHCGTILDLKWNYKVVGSAPVTSIQPLGERIQSPAKIVCLSACADDELSYSRSVVPILYPEGSQLTTALRYIFCRSKSLSQLLDSRKWFPILKTLAQLLKPPFTAHKQTPCLSSSRSIEEWHYIELPFDYTDSE